jgi:hypothetical protein
VTRRLGFTRVAGVLSQSCRLRSSASVTVAGLPDDRRRYGIGLALVGEVAARHGATVAAAASQGPGASIRLALPLIYRQFQETPRTAKDCSSDANPAGPRCLGIPVGAVRSSREGADSGW